MTPVLLMVRSLGAGGTERQLMEIARSLDRTRFQVHVGCFHRGMRADELESAGIPILQLPVRSFLKPGALLGAWQMIRYIRKHKIQLVHTFDYPLNCFGVPVALIARTPAILSSQRAHRDLTPALYWTILRITDRLVKGIVVNSDSVQREMMARERVPASRLHLCHNGIDTIRFHPAGRKRMPAMAGARLVVGAVCVLRPEKGLSTLLNGFAKFEKKHSGARLAIVGSGPELEPLQLLARELAIDDKVWFEPATADVPDWLRSIDIFVLPSLSEALSNALMEAMACGCACIASRTGGNPELIEEDKTGLLFQPGSACELAEKLASLASDQGLRERFAQAAAARIQSQFSLTASVARMQEIYEKVLANSTH
ncbi:MAG TPA: glycosyltransferase [Bryobacteraceae bacterium]|nr:glycosyltransferase [Bryobacteraceae bacterium]